MKRVPHFAKKTQIDLLIYYNFQNRQGEKMKRDNEKRSGMSFDFAGFAKESFLDEVGREAVKRAGRGDQLKGVIHEVLYKEKFNMRNILSGERMELTKSANARVVDSVVKRGSKIVSRVQVKDVVSSSGISEVNRRVKSGYYRSAKLAVNSESVSKVGRGSSKTVIDTGISSKTTTRVADNMGAKVRNGNLLRDNLADIGNEALGAAKFGAATSAAFSSYRAISSYKRGDMSGSEALKSVVVESAKGAGKAAAKRGAALAVKEGIKTGSKALGKNALKGNVATAVAFGVVEQGIDTFKYFTGDIDGEEYKKRSAGNVGSTGGAIAGASAGAAIGSVVPVVGTVIGAGIGGFIGSIGGGKLLKSIF